MSHVAVPAETSWLTDALPGESCTGGQRILLIDLSSSTNPPPVACAIFVESFAYAFRMFCSGWREGERKLFREPLSSSNHFQHFPPVFQFVADDRFAHWVMSSAGRCALWGAHRPAERSARL